jgi:Protein of unknown function (DUF2867)
MTTTETDRAGVPGRVSQVLLPDDARRLSTLLRVDYEDAFVVDADDQRTAEQWVRAVFNDAPLAVRARLVSGWTGLGLNLAGPSSARRVLGWKVQHSSPNVMLLAADSMLGLQAELLFRTEPRGLLFATLIQQNNPAARALWVRITPTHQKIVRSLLEGACLRVGAGAIGGGACRSADRGAGASQTLMQGGPSWPRART